MVTIPTPPKQGDCVPVMHAHVGRCWRAGWVAGYTDAAKVIDGEALLCAVGTCDKPAQPEHSPCCSSQLHLRPLCCEHYCRFHYVDVDPCSPASHAPVTAAPDLAATRAALRAEVGPETDRDRNWQPMVSTGEVRALLDALAAIESLCDDARRSAGGPYVARVDVLSLERALGVNQ